MLNVYPKLLDSVLLPAYYGLRGRKYAQRRRFLNQSQWWDPERLREFQWHEVKTLLRHAFSSGYLQKKYRDAGIETADDVRTWDDFRRLPPLTREEIAAHLRELCSTAYKEELLPHATGGSSGTPTRFFRTYESYDWRTATKDRAYEWSGWRLGEPSVHLWGAPVGMLSGPRHAKAQTFNRIFRQRIFNTFAQGDRLWTDVEAAVVRIRPTLILGYADSLERFAAFLRRERVTLPQVRAVISGGEMLFESARADIESSIHATVFNTYGSREFMSIAAECEQHRGLHVNAENLIVEVEDSSAQMSEILVTDLHNFGTPFVRYRIGDYGRLLDGRCPCGRGLPMLDAIEGRVFEVIRTPDGRPISGIFFPHIFKDVPEITQFQVEQKTSDHLLISAVLSAPIAETSKQLLEREIRKSLGQSITWEIRQVEDIPLSPSGKRRITIGLR